MSAAREELKGVAEAAKQHNSWMWVDADDVLAFLAEFEQVEHERDTYRDVYEQLNAAVKKVTQP